jgi:hypothetical protein
MFFAGNLLLCIEGTGDRIAGAAVVHCVAPESVATAVFAAGVTGRAVFQTRKLFRGGRVARVRCARFFPENGPGGSLIESSLPL